MPCYSPFVSIVIPAYNASNYLADAINSALAQTYNNIEIIVVNDGSKDNGATRTVAESFGDKIRYFEKENGGSSSALNYGIKQMKGEWFSWLSHDDLYYPQKIEKEVEFLRTLSSENLKYHVIFSAADHVDKDGKIISKPLREKSEDFSRKIEAFSDNRKMIASLTDYTFHGCSCLVNRNLFDEIGMLDESLRIVNDAEMWFRVYAAGCKIHYIPDVLVSGRVHAKQISRAIGYSYHNPEQDLLWNKRLEWLKENYPKDFNGFFEYGKNAFVKTRYEDGKKAFYYAAYLNPSKKCKLFIERIFLTFKGCFFDLLKKMYLKVKV